MNLCFLFRSERSSIDIQNKNELQKLRADLLREKEQKGKEGVTTTTERTTEVEQVDGGQLSREVRKTTEVHKAGGATVTVTKTTSKTELRQSGGGKGWCHFIYCFVNFDALSFHFSPVITCISVYLEKFYQMFSSQMPFPSWPSLSRHTYQYYSFHVPILILLDHNF